MRDVEEEIIRTMLNEPIKHHYIPQFILRNFCDEHGKLNYCDLHTGRESKEVPQDVFMERNLYRFEDDGDESPVQIEKDLAKFESEIAKLLKNKFLTGTDLKLTLVENDALALFLAIMPFRSKTTRDYYEKELTEKNWAFYHKYLKNGNLDHFWRRTLKALVNHRSVKTVFSFTHRGCPKSGTPSDDI